ncbi:uncharacterized protein F4807DRAFT_464073 [Annulohypoxylon truncatum]|uniref:uncharacterized protein n=1 Tax=Annulohypoxylon truncatum TaxID=327061 RepID=UPI00200827B5|nr:uncharacterized protein F4807DRAFT_464073 [Annulohypoxylon truncatum]KAI1206063.1 hypothetical protein F4807DRAFT_464073 [Annulohypoxylon truncatum]
MTRSHLKLQQLDVHTDYRSRGAGRMLTDWGINEADELGLKSCEESILFAIPIYEKYGLGHIDSLEPDVAVLNPMPKWKGDATDGLRVAMMSRPTGQNYRDDVGGAP